MRLRLTATLVLFLALLIGCDNRPQEVQREKARQPLVGALRSAASVTAHRVDKSTNSDGSLNFQVHLDGVQVDALAQSQLARALETIDFDPKRHSLCIFEPGVEYRFPAEGKVVGLQVCFICGEVRFVGGNGEGLSQIVAFDRAAEVELLRVTKTLFPNDSAKINKSPDAEVSLREAQDLESRGEIENAIRAYRRAARAGSAKAANRLGEIYETGMSGVSRDPAEAKSWRETARSLGG